MYDKCDKFKINMLVIIVITLWFSVISAETVNCRWTYSARGLSLNSPKMFNCNGIEGNISNNAKIKHLILKVTSLNGSTRILRLNNPTYGTVIEQTQTNPRLTEMELSKLGISRSNESIIIDQWGFDSDNFVYEDLNAIAIKGRLSDKCKYDNNGPFLLSYNPNKGNTGCSSKVCFAKVICEYSKNQVKNKEEKIIACPGKNDNECLDVSDCFSREIYFENQSSNVSSSCSKSKGPYLFDHSEDCSKKNCLYDVKDCPLSDGNSYTGIVVCAANDDKKCPKVEDCILDDKVIVSVPNKTTTYRADDHSGGGSAAKVAR